LNAWFRPADGVSGASSGKPLRTLTKYISIIVNFDYTFPGVLSTYFHNVMLDGNSE